MTKVEYRIETFGEGGRCVAVCPELGLSMCGDTQEEAAGCLRKAVEEHLLSHRNQGILEVVLEEHGFQRREGVWKMGDRTIENQVARIRSSSDAAVVVE